MEQIAKFTERPDEVEYMIRNDNIADVFVRTSIEEITEHNEDGTENHLFKCRENQFQVNPNEITEEMIRENIESWLDYNPISLEMSDKERLDLIEDTLLELLSEVYQ